MKPRALLSVTDKSGIVEFARGLHQMGFELVSTGGTAEVLAGAGLAVTPIDQVTHFPEMLDGRVKTLHPFVHAGLLADLRLPAHRKALESAEIRPIEILCVNLYAFETTVSNAHTLDEAIESIDIGGPAMIRAAAKNNANVTVVVDPADYASVLDDVASGHIEIRRLALAAKAYRHTAFYDSIVSRYLTKAAGENRYAETVTVGYRRTLGLRYGENPHQSGALYTDPLASRGIAQARQLWGVPPGYNNVLDADGAWELVADIPEPGCAIVKHGNPCGVAVGANYAESFRLARESDPISAFGGVVAVNGILDEEAAVAMAEKGNKLDVIVATKVSDAAMDVFKNRSGWGQDVRVFEAPMARPVRDLAVRSIRGGALLQDTDEDPNLEWDVVTKVKPTESQMAALRFVWKIVPHVKSNAIVIGTDCRMLGVGAGQMNRVQSVRLALQQAGDAANGAALASDAFFPFPDSVVTASEAGIAAICQPGGSKKDPEVIAEADARGIAMVFTKARHFLH